MTALALVRPSELDEVTPLVRPLLAEACARTRRFTADDVIDWIGEGKMQLWCVLAGGMAARPRVKAVCVTEILSYPRRTVLSVPVLVGEDRDEWLSHLDVLSRWARAQGCAEIEAMARPGWGRVLAPAGFKTTHIRIEKELSDA